ncbi:hypothetical protein [Haloparvum sp. AD34]
MVRADQRDGLETEHESGLSNYVRSISAFSLVFILLSQTPTVSAHGGAKTEILSQWHGIAAMVTGVVVLSSFVVLRRRSTLSSTIAIYGAFLGIGLIAVGGIIFEGLSPDPTYTASSMPFSRSWYQPLAIGLGVMITGLSLGIGLVRWPTRPRYMSLGLLMGGWVLYPYLLPGLKGYTNPIGYALILGTPILAGYVLWKDAGPVIYTILQDRVARRFGLGVGLVMALFFMSTTGYMSFFWEEGDPQQTTIVVMSVLYQLVMWPTLEVVLPDIPFFVAISPGVLIVVGTLSALIGLNAAVIARYWRDEEKAGVTQSTAGAASIVGACTCGCCGPLISQMAFVAASPAISAPLYWIFVDSASPLSSLFVIGSIVLFTGTLISSIDSSRVSARSAAFTPAD